MKLVMNSSLSYKLHLDLKIIAMIKQSVFKDILPASISKLLLYGINKKTGKVHLKISYKTLKKQFPDLTVQSFHNLLKLPCDDIVSSVESSSSSENELNMIFNLNQGRFIKELLLNKYSDLEVKNTKKNIVFEYSSPNIAKPFHVGHLRSAIIGNFLANLYKHIGHNVTRLNYLGDWGTQFGLLQVGLQNLNLSNTEVKSNPIQQLYNAYVLGNHMASDNEKVAAEARKIFNELESGNSPEVMERWKWIRTITLDELEKSYARLGIRFDDYHWESMYTAKEFDPLLKVMESNGLLENEDGKKVITVAEGKKVPLLKSDGSTLYLTRDVSAALDRWVTYRFDQMIYVVDGSQNQHFTALKAVLHKLDYDWAENLEHIKFGRIRGMSTRKGQVIFLKDILDEAQLRMAEKQQHSVTTKNFSNDVSDILGVSAVIVNDLKQRRMRDYSFDWDTALQSEGDTGVKLQYTHCRLYNLELNCGVALPNYCDPNLLTEPEAVMLVLEIARMQDVIEKAYSKLEAHEIVNYLFRLCNKTSQALKTLNVKHQSTAVAEQRLLLFHRIRAVLHTGMSLLGLQPLTSM